MASSLPLKASLKICCGVGGIYDDYTLNRACQETCLLENANSFGWSSWLVLLERVFLERVETFLGYVVLVKTAGLSGELFCFSGYVSVFAKLSDNLILRRAVFKPGFLLRENCRQEKAQIYVFSISTVSPRQQWGNEENSLHFEFTIGHSLIIGQIAFFNMNTNNKNHQISMITIIYTKDWVINKK